MHCFINGRFLAQPVTGVQRYARELMTALDRHGATGWSFELLVPPAVERTPDYTNIPVRHVGQRRGHVWEQLDLPRFLHDRGVLFCPANTAPVATLLSHVPVAVTVHDLSYRYFPAAYTRSFRLVYHSLMPIIMRRAGAVITVSHAERSEILKHYPSAADRLVVVPNGGVPATAVQADEALVRQRPYLLYVGSFSRRKNFPAVLAVARRLLDRFENLRAVFVGGNPKVFNEVDLGPPHDRMIFPGQIDDPARLLTYYASAEALLFPSLYESSGLPPTEAMACGCPCVVSRIPALVERCGDAAIYCDAENEDSIFTAAATLLTDAARHRVIVEAGLAQSRRFTWERCASETVAAIAGALRPPECTQAVEATRP